MAKPKVALHPITKWLRKPVYSTGVLLYQQYGTSPSLKRIFANSQAENNLDKLIYELRQLEGKV